MLSFPVPPGNGKWFDDADYTDWLAAGVVDSRLS